MSVKSIGDRSPEHMKAMGRASARAHAERYVAYTEADIERLLNQREAQGLPRQCSDPTALAAIVAVLREVTAGEGPAS